MAAILMMTIKVEGAMAQRQPYGRLTATDWILIGVLACVIVGFVAVAL